MYTPRPYQLDCLAALAKAREDGTKKGLVVMASGLGKTLTAAFDIRQFLAAHPNARVLCLCHQEEILLQSKSKFQKVFGEEYSYGLYTGNYKTQHAVNFLFATFQTMRDHREEFPSDAFAYILVDEAHHTSAETYQPTVDYFAPQFLLGLTATKDRMDGQDILDTYEQVLYEMDIYDGWNQDWLARVDYRIMLDDLNQEEFEKYVGPSASGEKVSLSQLNRTIFAPQRDEDIVKSIREQLSDLENPSIFVFCSSIDHAKNMAYHFGGEAAVIHSGQSSALNEATLSEFRVGHLRVVISVNMLNEGIDVPEADAIVFLRATESSTIFFQQLGRGLRTGATKRTVRVLDYVANLERISTILEMEETAKKRLPPVPTSSASPKPDPLIVNIPATKFRVQKADIEQLFISFKVGKWTESELITLLQRKGALLGGRVRCEDLRNDPAMPCFEAYLRCFGTWNNALRSAGLPAAQERIQRTDDELISDLKHKAEKLGRTPTAKEVDKDPNMASSSVYAKRFGGRWSSVVAAAGLEPIRKYSYSKEELVEALRRKIRELGHVPTLREMLDDPNMPSLGAYTRVFGSWVSALAEADQSPSRRDYTDEELIKMLQDAAKKLGRNPRNNEFKKLGLPYRSTYENHFGSWKQTLIAAGLAVVHVKLTREELIASIIKKAKELGRTPQRRDIDSDKSLPSASQYAREFGSWQNCIDAAGLKATRARRQLRPKQESN